MRRRPNILNWENGLFVLIYCLCVSFRNRKSQSQRPWLEVMEKNSGFLFVALNRSAISRWIAMLVSHITWNQLQGPAMTIQTWLKRENHWEPFRKKWDQWTLIPLKTLTVEPVNSDSWADDSYDLVLLSESNKYCVTSEALTKQSVLEN